MGLSNAFLKRGSLVRIQPGTRLFPSIGGVDPSAAGASGGGRKALSGTDPVHGPQPCGARTAGVGT